jgi:Fe-S cluster assembly protein SufD
MYVFTKNSQVTSLTIPACLVFTDPIFIEDDYEELHIHIGNNAQVTIMDTAKSSKQIVFLHVATNATVIYSMKHHIGLSVEKLKNISIAAEVGARCAIVSSIDCFGIYNFTCTTTSIARQAQFFVGCTATVGGNGTCLQTIIQLHEYENAQSESRVYAVVQDSGFFESKGVIEVAKGGKGTITSHKSHCLTIGAGAKAFAEPILKIIPFQVFCTHGAAVGPLDQAMLLYCASRGIEQNLAQIILQRAFLAQITDYCPLWASKAIFESQKG